MAFYDFEQDWKLVPVHAQYLLIDGTPVEGKVIFRPRPDAIIDAPALVTVLGGPIEVLLNAVGEFSVELPATDDTDLTVINWTYEVVEVFKNAEGESYDIEVPLSATEPGVDLITATRVPPASGELQDVERAEFDELVGKVEMLAAILDGGDAFSTYDSDYELDGGEA
jgi:hypothetical protein